MDQTQMTRCVGIDVAKAMLEVAVLPDYTVFQLDNDADVWDALLARADVDEENADTGAAA